MNDSGNVYIKQLLGGRDHARSHPYAGQMGNHAYLLGCRETGECLAVDPSWDPAGIVELARADGMTVVGGIATHGHADHIGGSMMGMRIAGIVELAELVDGPIHTHPDEVPMMLQSGISEDRLAQHADGGEIVVGKVHIEVLHTPGHSPGSISLLVDGHVLTGDVLFVGACGRVDLQGADPRKMYASLMRLAQLPPETVVWPGHAYGPAPRSTIGEERRTNPYLQVESAEAWVRMMGGPGW
jgi:glyoxylase-like metal-dependent hydrolase (beta-lactamase superfamily II)